MKKWILRALLALLCVPALAQTNLGPINTPMINSTLYVGSLSSGTAQFFPTIQSAVTAGCNIGTKNIVDIPPAYAGSDPISGVTGGCTDITLRDERVLPQVCYTWQTSVYSSSGISCAGSSGGGTPGGSSGSAQYNNAGSFAGLSGTGLEKLNGSSAPTIATPGIDYQNVIFDGIPITGSNPLYLSCHMRDDSDSLWISYSLDGTNWLETQVSKANLSASIRDPSCIYNNGTFYFVANNNGHDDTTIAYFTSTDLVNFTNITYKTVDGSSPNGIYPPKFFFDPVSTNYYVVTGVNLGSGRAPWIAQFTPSTGVFGTWSAMTLSGTTSGNTLDYQLWYANSQYYMFYVDVITSSPFQEALAQATSSTLNGTYTQVNTAGTNFLTNSAPVGGEQEAPELFTVQSTGCTRFIYDNWISPSAPNPNYHFYQSDNCDGTLTPGSSHWTAAVPVRISKAESGSIIELTTNASAAFVYQLAQTRPSNALNSMMGINAPTGNYAQLQINSMLNGSGINSNIAGSIAMDADASDTYPYLHSGYIGGCYGTIGGSTCIIPTTPLLGFLATNGLYGSISGLGGSALYANGSVGGLISVAMAANYISLDECCGGANGEGRLLAFGPNTSTDGYIQLVNTSSNSSVYHPILTTQNDTLNVLLGENVTGVFKVNGALQIYSGGSTTPAIPSIRWNGTTNLIISAVSTGALYLNYDNGTGGVEFGNGALGAVGSVSPAGLGTFLGGLSSGASNQFAVGTTGNTSLATAIAATSIANANSPSMTWVGNAWNGSASVTNTWTCFSNLSSWTTTPANVQPILECDDSGYNNGTATFKVSSLGASNIGTPNLVVSAAATATAFVVGTNQLATSGGNFSSPITQISASIWNGSGQASDQYFVQDIAGSGTNPSTTLTFSKGGGTSGLSSAWFNMQLYANQFGAKSTQTTVNCSTSGTAVFSQPEVGSAYRQIVIYADSCLGTASYNFPVSFTNTPQVLSQSLASIASSVSNTAVTVTGTTSTGFLELDGY